MIWNEAMPGERILEAYCKQARGNANNVMHYKPAKIIIKNPPPALLHVNQESRAEALKRYTLRLDTEYSEGLGWIDPSQDVVYFPWVGSTARNYGLFDGSIKMKEGILSHVYQLAIDLDALGVLDDPNSENYAAYLRTLSEFCNLEDFIIILHRSTCKEGWALPDSELSLRPPKWDFFSERNRNDEERADKIEATFQKVNDTFGPGYQAPEIYFSSIKRDGSECCFTKEEEEEMSWEESMADHMEMCNEVGLNSCGYDILSNEYFDYDDDNDDDDNDDDDNDDDDNDDDDNDGDDWDMAMTPEKL
jgi:hypothetical protein